VPISARWEHLSSKPPSIREPREYWSVGVLEYWSNGKSISEQIRVVKMSCRHYPEFVYA
jgi:hypothetical protein